MLTKIPQYNVGTLVVITGGMFSGKTEALIWRIKRAVIARQSVGVIKHCSDVRYSTTDLASHAQSKFSSTVLEHSSQVMEHAKAFSVIGIDEVQFFDPKIVSVCLELVRLKRSVIVAGLDMDFRGIPFEITASLMAQADRVLKLHAICTQCGQRAVHSVRLGSIEERILVGGSDQYEARCRACFSPP